MFRHVVMFRWTPETTDGDIAAASNSLNEMAAKIPQIRRYQHGGDVGMNEGNFDYVIVADFDNPEDYVVYRDDPLHQKLIVELIRPMIAERAAVQYEVADGS